MKWLSIKITIGQARNPQEALALNNAGKIAAVIGVEGGHTIENSLTNLANLYNSWHAIHDHNLE
ncbi:MAG: membrane dipeptidase [Ignavibacteriales bacterium]|nr:membrane dipeptidase [Ignavibacteriales bacterium]